MKNFWLRCQPKLPLLLQPHRETVVARVESLPPDVTVPLAQVKAFAVEPGRSPEIGVMFPLRRAQTWHGAHDACALGSGHGFFVEPGLVRAAMLPVGSASLNLLLVFQAPVQFDVDTKLDAAVSAGLPA